MAHSRPVSNTGPRQLELSAEEGVDSEKVQIAHTGDTEDLDYIEGHPRQRHLHRPGPPRLGHVPVAGQAQRHGRRAAAPRLAEKIFISQDFCATIDWFPPEAIGGLIEGGQVRDWSKTLVFEQVPPTLREEGAFTDQHFEQIFRQTPRRWLAG